MKECNTFRQSVAVTAIFQKKLKEFEYLGERCWGNPAESMKLETYKISGLEGELYCAIAEWVKANTFEKNRMGIIATLPNTKATASLGQITEITIPYYFNRQFNTRAYEDNDTIEIRNYGKFTVNNRSLKKELFFSFLREMNMNEKIHYDEELKPYIRVFEIIDGDIGKVDFADSLIDFTLLVKAYKDRYR